MSKNKADINKTNEFQIDKENIKESFCPTCLIAGVAALSTASAVQSSKKTTTAEETRNKKALIFWISIIITFVSILILIYLICFRNCDECA